MTYGYRYGHRALPWVITGVVGVSEAARGAVSQILTVASADADANRLPSGLQATAVARAMCPRIVKAADPPVAGQIFTVRSSLAVASRVPSGLHAPAETL